MGSLNNVIFKMDKINKNASKEEVKTFLSNLTDEDFNGNNGSDYFIEVDIGNVKTLMSSLDSYMIDFNHNTILSDFIIKVLESNYSNSYYFDFNHEIMEINDFMVVAISSSY